jgi:hypothetical protein
MLQNSIAQKLDTFLAGQASKEGTAFASAARTATESSADITNSYGSGVRVVFDVTASAATPSVVLTIQGKDAVSGKYYTLLTGAAVTGASTNVYTLFPSVAAVANVAVSNLLPKTFRITMTHADADSITYSVGYTIL